MANLANLIVRGVTRLGNVIASKVTATDVEVTNINNVAVGSSPKFTDNNTTYTFAGGTNKFTVTPSGGSAQDVTVTPSITNNVTGSGTSGYIAKFNGANTITSGPQLGTATTTYLRNDGSWASPDDRYPYYGGIGTVIPENADLDTYTTPGTYYSEGSTKTATLSNVPSIASGFKMYVETNYIEGRVFQRLSGSHMGALYTRYYNGTSWSAWANIKYSEYGTCSTAAGTNAKVVECENFGLLLAGVTIHVKFTNSNTASTPTLNVNGTGAKSIYRYGTTKPGTSAAWSWYAGAIVSFTYDGSAWIMNDMIGNDNTYDREYVNGAVKAETAITAAFLTCGTAAGYKNVAKGASFDISYPVLYQGTATSAGSTRTDFYQSIPFNCTTTNGGTSPAFTAYKAVYLYGTLSGSTFTIDSSTIFTQTIPTSENGKAYYYLGPAYSATNIKLMHDHKIFEYVGGAFREYTNYSVAKCDYSDSTATLEFYNEIDTSADMTPITTAEIDTITA